MEKLPINLGLTHADLLFDKSKETFHTVLHRLLNRWSYRTRAPREKKINILIKASEKSFEQKSQKAIKKFLDDLKDKNYSE